MSRLLLEDVSVQTEVEQEYKKAYGVELDWKTVPCVVFKDLFLSGWGMAEGRSQFRVVLCKTAFEANKIESHIKAHKKELQVGNPRRETGTQFNPTRSYDIGKFSSAFGGGTIIDEPQPIKEAKADTAKLKDELEELLDIYNNEGLEDITNTPWKSILVNYPNFAKYFIDFYRGLESDDSGRHIPEDAPSIEDYWEFMDDSLFKAAVEYAETNKKEKPIKLIMKYDQSLLPDLEDDEYFIRKEEK